MNGFTDLEAHILQRVTELQGVKATELIAKINPDLDFRGIPRVIDELINKGELVEIIYVLPTMAYKAKSFLLPKGTKVTAR